jgi:cell pole-organizing protein PopZ
MASRASHEDFVYTPPVVKAPTTPATQTVTSREADRPFSTPTRALEVSNETLKGVAREAIEKAAREILERVAWEVIPDLAERLIREEIERLKAEK